MSDLMQDFETIDKINLEADAQQKMDLLYEMQRGLEEQEHEMVDPVLGGKLVADEIRGAVDEHARVQALERVNMTYDDKRQPIERTDIERVEEIVPDTLTQLDRSPEIDSAARTIELEREEEKPGRFVNAAVNGEQITPERASVEKVEKIQLEKEEVESVTKNEELQQIKRDMAALKKEENEQRIDTLSAMNGGDYNVGSKSSFVTAETSTDVKAEKANEAMQGTSEYEVAMEAATGADVTSGGSIIEETRPEVIDDRQAEIAREEEQRQLEAERIAEEQRLEEQRQQEEQNKGDDYSQEALELFAMAAAACFVITETDKYFIEKNIQEGDVLGAQLSNAIRESYEVSKMTPEQRAAYEQEKQQEKEKEEEEIPLPGKKFI